MESIGAVLICFTCPSNPFKKILTETKMEALLERIAQNTEPKSSMQIVVTDNKTQFKTRFNPPIQLDKSKRYEIALVNLETYHSFSNIKSTNNYFICSPDNGAN